MWRLLAANNTLTITVEGTLSGDAGVSVAGLSAAGLFAGLSTGLFAGLLAVFLLAVRLETATLEVGVVVLLLTTSTFLPRMSKGLAGFPIRGKPPVEEGDVGLAGFWRGDFGAVKVWVGELVLMLREDVVLGLTEAVAPVKGLEDVEVLMVVLAEEHIEE